MLIDFVGLIITKIEKNYVNIDSRERETEREKQLSCIAKDHKVKIN